MEPADGESVVEEEHPSDAFLRVRAPSLPRLYAAAARGVFALMTDLDAVRPAVERAVSCVGRDREDLLVAWLNELIGLAGSEDHFFRDFEIDRVEETRIDGRARGEPIDRARHALRKEVKAATYHALSIRQTTAGWEATVVLDL